MSPSVSAAGMVKTSAVLTMAAVITLFSGVMFKLDIQIDADSKQSLDPATQYLYSITKLAENGEEISYYLSKAVELGIENPDGFNLTEFFWQFKEGFELKDDDGNVIFRKRGRVRRPSIVYYAVPDGGLLKMEYQWLRT